MSKSSSSISISYDSRSRIFILNIEAILGVISTYINLRLVTLIRLWIMSIRSTIMISI